MKIPSNIVKIARYVIFLPPLAIFGLLTLPLTLLFRWSGFWLLAIMYQECCSLKQAKKLFKEDPKYKVAYGSSYTPFSDAERNKSFNQFDNDFSAEPSSTSLSRYQSDPVYYSFSNNIYHRN